MNKKIVPLLTTMLALCLLLVGCYRGTPEDQVANVEQKLSKATTLSGRLESNLQLNLEGVESELGLNMDTQLDFSKDFPIIDLDGDIAVMGIKANFMLYLNDQFLYFKAMDNEQVTEIDDEIRQQIRSAMQAGTADSVQTHREITRQYEDQNQLLILKYDTAALNDEIRSGLQGGSSIFQLTEDVAEPTTRSSYDGPQFAFDKVELVYVLDGTDTLKEIRGKISCNIFADDELANLKINFTYRVDQLGGEIDITQPSYTTTTRRSWTTERTERPIEDERGGEQKQGETEEMQQSTQAKDEG